MFFHQRATQAEYFDSPDRSHAEMVDAYESLASVNRLCCFAEPFRRFLPKLLGSDRCQSLSILDLGAGDGLLAGQLTEWATKRGWQWRFTNVDVNPAALRLNPAGRNVAGSVLALPFRNASFDVVIASQMTHHLSDAEVVIHLREAWRVARSAVFLSDLHRGWFLYGMLQLLLRVRRYPRHFREDGLLSVRRGFRVGEWRALAGQAGIGNARVWLYCGTRILMQARKPAE